MEIQAPILDRSRLLSGTAPQTGVVSQHLSTLRQEGGATKEEWDRKEGRDTERRGWDKKEGCATRRRRVGQKGGA